MAFNIEEWRQAYNSLIEFGKSALTTSALLNGGAAAAILAALTATESPSTTIKHFSIPLLLFSLGAGCAMLSLGLSYLAEFAFLQSTREDDNLPCWVKYADTIRTIAIIIGACSIFLFWGGIYTGYQAVKAAF